ncbi:hypothetical protein PHYPSEUDO_004796 [Phytophthora pseudosyringae]|uniref:Uncharacterized protein n=1 Tax=Phytophthora pseudosyringae TaxID=221518 RepID=A0A8T1VQT1_9STRA|nr:hypothetical protein PHYPSEUDO_004796 [Phytophthora pseudosyringae]
MDDGVWDAAAPRALEGRPTGLKTLLMEELVSALCMLNAASCEQLAAEQHDELELAMTRALGWLHRQIATPPLRTEASYSAIGEEQKAAELSALKELSQVFLHWHKLQQSMSGRLWMLWAELGCALDVLRHCKAAEEEAGGCVQLVRTSQPPRGFPTSSTRCNKEKQVAFSRELWGAVLAKPLYGAPAAAVAEVAPRLMDVYLFWLSTAMRGCELEFLANVATPLRGHLEAASTSNPLLADAWLKFANSKMGAASITKSAASVAGTVLVLSAVTSTRRSLEVAGYLESLSAATVDGLSRGPFPHPHDPVAIVAMALGLAILDDARPHSHTAIRLQSGNATLLCQFALLRLVSLQLLPSSRINSCDDDKLTDYQGEVYRRLKALVLAPSHAVLQEYSLRMTETCIEEMVGFFQTSLVAYLSLLDAVRSVLPEDLFRPKLLTQFQESTHPTAKDGNLLASAPEVVAFLKQFYGGVAPILEVLSAGHLVRSFLALSRIEFAREVCAAPTANASMQLVTQHLEQALEQTATPPDTIFAPVLRSLAMHSMSAKREIPPEVDIVAGCQVLAVGLVMQRKLRILLFQCAPLIDDALAVVFSGLYNVFEPADAFAHRFLGVCLSHLGQFTPLFTVFPHYLQVTLAAYPANASPQALTKACGAIFGSLFYSEALTMPSVQNNEITETAQQMVVWAIRKGCDRSTELLVDEAKMAVSTGIVKSKAGEKRSIKNAAASETDGLYLAGLVFELMKMAPMNILKASAMEAESLLVRWKNNPSVLRALKSALFARVSQNCEAEKRAWFAAWYIEVDKQYPVETPVAKPVATSRL